MLYQTKIVCMPFSKTSNPPPKKLLRQQPSITIKLSGYMLNGDQQYLQPSTATDAGGYVAKQLT